jgi:hypothetical protein
MMESVPYIDRGRKNVFIIFFIYLSIFINSYVFFKEPFEFYLGYVIFIALLPNFIIKYGLNRDLFFIFFILLLIGIFNIFFDNNTTAQFIKVFIGLVLSYLFYYYVILELEFDLEQLFIWYLKGSYIVALIGIFQFVSFQIGFKSGARLFNVFNKWGFSSGGLFGFRVNSVFAEPTHLGAVLSAAFFVSVYNLFVRKGFYLNKIQSMVIIVVYFLSFSGLGQIGIFLTLLFLAISFGLVRYIIVAIPVAIFVFNFMYNNLEDFRDRLDSSIDLFVYNKEFELGKTHGSSFILYNNYRVALENFKTNFLFGTGLGSHPVAFEKYSIAKDIKAWGFNLNSQDANSMLLRLISETGLFGVGLFLLLIIKCYVPRNRDIDSHHWLISNGILIMILLNMFRQGHYFLNGFPFFVFLYYFNSIAYKKYLNELVLPPQEKSLNDSLA